MNVAMRWAAVEGHALVHDAQRYADGHALFDGVGVSYRYYTEESDRDVITPHQTRAGPISQFLGSSKRTQSC
jgi:hypothetical protein